MLLELAYRHSSTTSAITFQQVAIIAVVIFAIAFPIIILYNLNEAQSLSSIRMIVVIDIMRDVASRERKQEHLGDFVIGWQSTSHVTDVWSKENYHWFDCIDPHLIVGAGIVCFKTSREWSQASSMQLFPPKKRRQTLAWKNGQKRALFLQSWSRRLTLFEWVRIIRTFHFSS